MRKTITAIAIAALAAGGLLFAPSGTAGATPSDTCTVTHNSDTGNGANTSGAYDSTCDGSASQNGQGKAQPCAGLCR